MSFRFSRPGSKQIFAALLAFWMSGAMLLLCCGATHGQAKSEHCPLQKSRCDRSKAEKSASLLSAANAVDCCRFPSAVFDKARKLESNLQATQPSERINVAAPQFFAIVKFQASRISYHAPILDRGGTYLKNRVFRI